MLNLVFFVIAVALVFDFLNGFHDAANSVATVVTTRVLSPLAAVFWAAFFNFAAAFIFGTGVAQTISGHLIDPKVIDVYVVFGGLLGAIAWDIFTWWLALPTSSSHAIISGFAGAAIAKAGFKALLLKGWVPVITFLIVSPIFGFILAYILMVAVTWMSHKTPRHKAESIFRRLQLVSAGAYGSSFLGRHQEISWWIILSCHAAIGLGTLSGGWRIVKTMGSRITPHLRPIGGFSAELAAATTIGIATLAKVPISTTHAIGGAISGVGAARGPHYVRWIWGKKIAWAWILTFPGAGLVGAGAFLLLHVALQPFFGTVNVK
jgi:inorganic phosphate transporter, PiT family